MAFDTAANVISDAAIQLGLAAASISDPYAPTDDNIKRLNACLAQLGQDLLRDYQWSHLTEEHTFQTADTTPNYALPSGFARIVNQTAWNRTTGQPMLGPLSAQRWQQLKSALASAFVNQGFRIWQDEFWIHPTPTGIETVSYEYVSKFWVAVDGNSAPSKQAPTAGTDVLWFDRALLVWALKLYFKNDTGFLSESEQRMLDARVAAAQGSDGASPVLRIAGRVAEPDAFLVPDTGFGS